MAKSESRLVNEEGVDGVLSDLQSPVARNLVQLAVAAARMQFMRYGAESDASRSARLPLADFDLGFFARVVAKSIGNQDVLRSLLSGRSIAEATGWDLEDSEAELGLAGPKSRIE